MLQEENYKKSRQDSLSLIKIKICKTDEIIRLYNDKILDCDSLKQELNAVKGEKNDILQKYNLCQQNIAKLNLENSQFKTDIDEQNRLIENQEAKIQGDQKNIDQLQFKIRDLEKKHELELKKVKEAEAKVKTPKKSVKKAHFGCQADGDPSPIPQEVVIPKPETSHKSTYTERSAKTDDPFAFFCSECQVNIVPNPLNEICKKMSMTPMPITEIVSPPGSPVVTGSRVFQDLENMEELEINESQVSFMEVDRMKKRIKKLETNMKKSMRQKDCYRSNGCCNSMNDFTNMFSGLLRVALNVRRGGSRNLKKNRLLKRLQKHKKVKSKKKLQRLMEDDWTVETGTDDTIESVNGGFHESLIQASRGGSHPQAESSDFKPTKFNGPLPYVNTILVNGHPTKGTSPIVLKLKSSEDFQQLAEIVNSSNNSFENFPFTPVNELYSSNLANDNHILSPIEASTPHINHIVEYAHAKTEKNTNNTNSLENESLSNRLSAIKSETTSMHDDYDNQDYIESPYSPEPESSIDENSDNESKNPAKRGNGASDEEAIQYKRRKTVAVISSGEEEMEQEEQRPPTLYCSTNNCMESISKIKNPGLSRKKLLSKIRNLKNISKRPIPMTSEPRPSGDQLVEDCSKKPKCSIKSSEIIKDNVIIVPKKLRVAHKPKEIDYDNLVNKPASQTSALTPALSKLKKTRKSKTSETMDETNKVDSILKELDKSGQERKEILKNLRAHESLQFEATNLKNMLNYLPLKKEEPKPDEQQEEINEVEVKEEETPIEPQVDIKSEESINEVNEIVKEEVDEEPENVKMENTDDPDLEPGEIKEERIPRSMINNNVLLRPRMTRGGMRGRMRGGSRISTRVTRYYKPPIEEISEHNSCLTNCTIVKQLNEFMKAPDMKTRNLKPHMHKHVQMIKAKRAMIEKEIENLKNADPWTTAIQTEIQEKLYQLDEPKIVALVIIDTLEEFMKAETHELDKSHTPPAPLMTKFEQKLTVLITNLDKKFTDFTELVVNGLRYKLFRLGPPLEECVVDGLFRLLVVLVKTKKDREKVRILICEALYCLNLRAVNVIYNALIAWPEVLPAKDSMKDVLLQTVIHIIMTMETAKPYPRLVTLRKLLSSYYGYPGDGYISNVFRDELLKQYLENVPHADTALLLLSKKLGPELASSTVLHGGLLQMIVGNHHPDKYKSFRLLGSIMRSFSSSNNGETVSRIVTELTDVFSSSFEQNRLDDESQEGILSALLDLSRFQFDVIALCVMRWPSTMTLRTSTQEKLLSFFRTHDAQWWRKFITDHFPPRRQSDDANKT